MESATAFAGLVLDAQAIRRSQAVTLEGLLDGLPGVSITSSGGHGSLSSLFLRGAESDHALVLVDGVSVNALSSDTARLEFLNPRHFAQLEVLRGPRSALYGSQGIGGVMHLISAAPRLPEQAAAPPESRLSQYLGSNGLAGFTLSSRYRNRDDVDMHWSASAERLDGIDRHQAGSDDRDGASLYAVRYGLQGDAGEGAWWLDASARRGKSEYDNPYASPDQDNYTVVRERQGQVGWRGPLAGDWRASARASGFRNHDVAEDALPLQSRSARHALSVQVLRVVQDAEWRAIVDWTQERYALPGRAPLQRSRRHRGAVGGLWSQRFGAHLVEASLRWDRSSQFGGAFSPQLAWALDAGAWRWRLGYGEGFKTPSFEQLYQDFPAFSYYANPDLRPESSRSLEAGMRYQGRVFELDVSGFGTELRDLISARARASASDASAPSDFVQANVGRARMRGIELASRWEFDAARLAAYATWLDAVNRDSGEDLLRRPKFSGRFELSWRSAYGELTAQLAGRRDWLDVGPLRMPGYALLNLRWERRWQARYRIGLALNNATNRRYQLLDGYRNPTRNLTASLAYTL